MSMDKLLNFKLLKRDDDTVWEQVVMAEVLIPNIPNVYGDLYTAQAIRDFAYAFAMAGYGIDVEHDQNDVNGVDAATVESFIVRPGDPDFIEGSWVVAMKILNPDLWADILSGEINGYSFEAICAMTPIMIQNLRNRQVSGVTEEDPEDGHTHTFLVLLDPLNRPITGGTGVTDDHFHTITTHSITDVADDHVHRYQVINDDEEGTDGVFSTPIADGSGT